MAALISFAKPSLAPDDLRLLVQAFVSEFPIEALDVRVLCRFTWFDEVELHTVFVSLWSTTWLRNSGPLSTMILAVIPRSCLSRSSTPTSSSWQRRVHLDGQSFSTVTAHQIQGAEFSAIGHAVSSTPDRPEWASPAAYGPHSAVASLLFAAWPSSSASLLCIWKRFCECAFRD